MDLPGDAGLGAMTADQPGTIPPEATDPAASVEQAAEAGTLATERTQEPTSDEVRASVERWWRRTSETADFTDAIEQADNDLITLRGADPKKGDAKAQIDDASQCTVNHIYRNGIQTVAMTVPESHAVKWDPREMVEPLPGEPADQQVTQLRRQATGLGKVMGILALRYTEEINFQETVEAWVQDAAHFRIAVLKVMWQQSYEDDQISGERLPDEQDNLARLRYMLEQYQRGEFSKNDYQWSDIRQLMGSLNKVQVAVRNGLVIEEVPIDQWRCDPRVTGPENVYSAEWMRHDVLMTRAEVLSKWPDIDPDDLNSAHCYTMDSAGKMVKQNAIDKSGNRENARVRGSTAPAVKDDDLLLVAEIHDAVTNSIIVLVEGLEYPAAEYAPERTVDGFFPFVVLVLNRFPKQLYGLSDTELQAKSQAAANRQMAGGEEARKAAQPRFAYDTQIIEAKDAQRIANGEPWEMIGLNLGGKDVRTAIMPLVGNHEFNAIEYDPTMHFENMRRMAALPEQALGVTGVAKFATEANIAAAGSSILAKYRQARITRALTRLYNMVGQLLLMNVGPDTAVKFGGPLAAKYWPAQPPARQAIYEWLAVKVSVALDAQLDQAKKAETQAKLFEAAARLGVRVPANAGAKLMAKTLGEDEAAELFQPDPNNLVGDLAQSLQESGPGALAPETMAMLAQLGATAQQQLVQMQQQALAQLPAKAQAEAQLIPGQAEQQLPAAAHQMAGQLAKAAMSQPAPAQSAPPTPAPAGA